MTIKGWDAYTVSEVVRLSEAHGLPPILMLAIAVQEGGLKVPFPRGDGGKSLGPYQIYTTVHPQPAGYDITYWEDPLYAVERAFKEMSSRWTFYFNLWGGWTAWNADPMRFLADVTSWRNGVTGANFQGSIEWNPTEVRDNYNYAVEVYNAWWDGANSMKPPITWVGAYPGNFRKGKGGVTFEAVVYHITEGGMPGGWFNDPRSGVSTHFAISKQGTIEQYVDLADTAFAHGLVEVTQAQARQLIKDNWGVDPNTWAVGIEFEGTVKDVEQAIVPTPAQMAAAAQLTAWLFKEVLYDPAAGSRPEPSRDRILMHRDISPKTKSCPVWGEAVQNRLIDRVKEVLNPPVVIEPPKPTLEQLLAIDINLLIDGLEDMEERVNTLLYQLQMIRKGAVDSLGKHGIARSRHGAGNPAEGTAKAAA